MTEDDLVAIGMDGEAAEGQRKTAAGGELLTALFAPTGTNEIAAAVVEALGDRRAALLARHGVVAVGETPAAALNTCVAVERQAQIAWLLRG
jgi:ribulose-5-phosphate 4-epimerase/fuculose-1-phosphate aldolase